MEDELFGRLEHSHRRQVRRHRLVAAASIVLLAGGGVAAVNQANSVVVSNAAYCYVSASTGASSVQVEAPDIQLHGKSIAGATSLAGAAAIALEHCADAWKVGAVDPSSSTTYSPHQLQACVRNDQVIAVFPKTIGGSADDFCTNLGMSAP
jgi:hypothetical protein